MNKITITILSLLISCSAFAQIGTWTAKANLTVSRTSHTAFSLNGKGYICGGTDNSDDFGDLWQYDPSNNTWSQKADLPGFGRRELSSFTIGDFGYVGHGRNLDNDIIFTSFYKYDPSQNQWTQIEDCPVQRYTSTGFSIDSIGYITCGILPGVARYKDLYAYNPRTDSWSQKESLPSTALNRSYATVVTLDHKAYLMGGFEGNVMKDFYEYDPVNNSWTQKADYPGGTRNACAGFAIGNYVVMGMGRNTSNTTFKDVYYYNPKTDVWTQMKDYPETNSAGFSTFVINNVGYVVGGNNLSGTVTNKHYSISASQLLSVENSNVATNFSSYKPLGINQIKGHTVPGLLNVNIFDMTGKSVQRSQLNLDLESDFTISLENHSKGIYFAEFIINGQTNYLKFIID